MARGQKRKRYMLSTIDEAEASRANARYEGPAALENREAKCEFHDVTDLRLKFRG